MSEDLSRSVSVAIAERSGSILLKVSVLETLADQMAAGQSVVVF